MDDLVDALIQEIALRKDYLSEKGEKATLDTIYFGGGTPSLLSEIHFEKIFLQIHKYFNVSHGAEITLESNPDDLTYEKLAALKRNFFNRLSIGVQSFFDEDLLLMNRAHNSKEAESSVINAAAAGFGNITIDLIYGIPGMNDERWISNLEKAFSLPVQHLSSYNLTVEKKTALNKMIREGIINNVDDDVSARQFKILMDLAEANGFEHYEISNLAKPGFRSRHNSRYWSGEPYLGIGPSAHSFNRYSRSWNIASNAAYILAIKKGEVPGESETLTPGNRYNEYMMTGLRTAAGVNIDTVVQEYGDEFAMDFIQQITPYVNSGHVIREQAKFSLSREGKLLADRIAAAVFVV